MTNGFVYILRNEYLATETGDPLLKIGGTARSAHERARELSQHTGVPGEFTVVFETETGNWEQLEALSHRELRRFRKTNEFFAVDLDEATRCIQGLKDRLSYLRDVEVPYRDIASDEVNKDGVCFVEKHFGFSVYVDAMFVGDVYISDADAMYDFSDEHGSAEIIFAPIFRMPGRVNRWSRKAVLRSAKRRAAWLAPIIRRFITPTVTHEPEKSRYRVDLNGLPLAVVNIGQRQSGLIFKKEVPTFRLEKLPFQGSVTLIDDFEAQTCLAHHESFDEAYFHIIEAIGLEESIRRFVMDDLLITVSMSNTKWRCSVRVMNYKIDILEQATADL